MEWPWWNPFAVGAKLLVAPPPSRNTGQKGGQPSKNLKGWQKQAWGYFKTLGEIHYGAGFYARMLSGVVLSVQERGADGEWTESADQDYIQQLERLENARGGTAEIQASYGRLTFVQGESMLSCTLEGLGEDEMGEPILTADGEAFVECWEMLSAAELTYNPKGAGGEGEYTRRRTQGGKQEKIPETDPDDPQPGTMTAWRFYHRDPEYSGEADSSMRAVLEDCEELLLLKRSIRNTARNRGAGNGILVLPKAMQGQMLDAPNGKKISENAKAIYEALTAPIADETAAHAVTPIILFAPDGVTSSDVFHIDLRGAALYRETGLRDECIRRIAIGLDMPPEALLGTSGVNHWTAWQISDASWTNHGDPVAREFVEQLTAALIAPIAVEKGTNPLDVRIWYDASEVVQDPDRGRAAQDAWDRLLISDEKARIDLGYDEADKPSDEEWQKRADLFKKPASVNPNKGEPKQGQATVTPERLIGMAEACMLRCRELAGSRLRTKMNGNGSPANLRVRIKGTSNVDVAAKLGTDVRDDCDPDTLVAGAGAVFLGGMTRLGLNPGLAESLVRRVEEHAARTLFEEETPPLTEEIIAICALTSLRI